MANLDIRSIDRKVSSASVDQLKSYLLDSSCILSEGALTISLLLSFLDINPAVTGGLVGASLVSTFNSLVAAVRKSIKFGVDYKRELLKETDEYERCLMLYNEYIKMIAHFIKNMGVSNSLEVAMIYMELLFHGDLSKNGRFEYHKYSRDYDFCQDLWGARVLSGRGVCRHIASNLLDIYKELGQTACYLSVRSCGNNFKDVISSKIKPQPANHAVVVVYDNDGKYIVDPTKRMIAQFLSDSDFAQIVWGREKYGLYRINYNEYIDRNRKFSFEEFLAMRNSKNKKFYKRYLEVCASEASNTYLNNRAILVSFREYLARYIEEISVLEKMLSSYRDISEESRGSKRVIK